MAGGASGIRAGRAFVEMLTDNTGLTKGLQAAGRQLQSFGSSVTALGAGIAAAGLAMLGPLLAASKQFMDQGSALANMSKRTGVAVEDLSKLGFAAEQSGATIGDVEAAVRAMQKAITSGTPATQAAFQELGLDLEEVAHMAPIDQFTTLAGAISTIEDPTTRAALAMGVMGKSATTLLPLFNDGAEGIRALTDEFDKLGGTVSTEQAQAAASLSGAWGKVTKQVSALTFSIGGALAPALTDLLNAVTPYLAAAIDWVKDNQEVIVSVASVAAALVGIGTVVAAVGAGIAVLGAALSGIVAAVSFLLTPIGLIFAGLTALAGVVLGLAAAWIWSAAEGKTFGEKMSSIWKSVQKWAWWAVDKLMDAASTIIAIWNHLGDAILLVPRAIGFAFSAAFDHATWFFRALGALIAGRPLPQLTFSDTTRGLADAMRKTTKTISEEAAAMKKAWLDMFAPKMKRGLHVPEGNKLISNVQSQLASQISPPQLAAEVFGTFSAEAARRAPGRTEGPLKAIEDKLDDIRKKFDKLNDNVDNLALDFG